MLEILLNEKNPPCQLEIPSDDNYFWTLSYEISCWSLISPEMLL